MGGACFFLAAASGGASGANSPCDFVNPPICLKLGGNLDSRALLFGGPLGRGRHTRQSPAKPTKFARLPLPPFTPRFFRRLAPSRPFHLTLPPCSAFTTLPPGSPILPCELHSQHFRLPHTHTAQPALPTKRTMPFAMEVRRLLAWARVCGARTRSGARPRRPRGAAPRRTGLARRARAARRSPGGC